MAMIAEFADETKSAIIGIFSSLQPVEWVPFQEEVFADDPRYKTWYEFQKSLGMILDGFPEPTAP